MRSIVTRNTGFVLLGLGAGMILSGFFFQTYTGPLNLVGMLAFTLGIGILLGCKALEK